MHAATRVLLASLTIGRFATIGFVFAPYLSNADNTVLYVLQTISVAGIGIAGLRDLQSVVKPVRYEASSLPVIVWIVYAVPFATVCAMLSFVAHEPVTTVEYDMSVYIALVSFMTSVVGCLWCGMHLCSMPRN
jgi:hypothetical protein